MRDALKNLLRSVGLAVETFGTAQEFLAAGRDGSPRCLILDVRLPGTSGLDLQHQLAAKNHDFGLTVQFSLPSAGGGENP